MGKEGEEKKSNKKKEQEPKVHLFILFNLS